MPSKPARFHLLTENAGVGVTTEGAEMLATRYAFAQRLARGRRVLEVGCASGVGFGLVLNTARSLFGADYSAELLQQARAHYRDRVPLVRCTAEALPYASGSFDAVLLFEAAYYIPNLQRAIAEFARVLAPAGELVIVSANPERPGFIKSPHSTHYPTADEYAKLLSGAGLSPALYGAFAIADASQPHWLRAMVETVVRQVASALHLIPRTLRGRARLKRLLGKSMIPVPAELPRDFARAHEPTPLNGARQPNWKVLYAVGTKR